MSEHSNETAKVTPSVEASASNAPDQPSQQSTEKSCCTRGSCCKPHTSAIIAVIALILAGYAAFAASSRNDDSAVYARLDKLDSQATALSEQLSEQINTLKDEVKSNRENLIQTKLKKALQNIQDIGDLAGEGTKAAITEVEKMLKTLTSISEQLQTPAPTESTPAASIEPASEPIAEPTPEPEVAAESTAPAEITAPVPEQPAITEPVTSPTDSSITDQTATTSETAPVTDAPADAPADTPVDTPAKTQPTTNTAPADTAPAVEPSAPQAF